MSTVYIGMTADIIHNGLINVIRVGREYGPVTIGLLTDAAVATYKRLPYLSFDQRKEILENIEGVSQVVPQDEWDYSPNLRRYRPTHMIHGDDWSSGSQRKYRELAHQAMLEWGGQVIEVPYTKGVSSADFVESATHRGTTPDRRRRTLRRLLDARPMVRILEAHSPLSALIAEKARVETEEGPREFDGVWSSSLTTSTVLGKPDIEAVDHTARLLQVNDIFEVTTKPMIYDGDTGGLVEHLRFTVRTLERTGVSAAIFEDKMGLKKNSLFGTDVRQQQCPPEVFCEKLQAAREAKVTDDFMVIARIESLILEAGMKDALHRAAQYVEAGADGLMIHSRRSSPDEIFDFSRQFRKAGEEVPLVCVPSSYDTVSERELSEVGLNVVIYANHLLRSSYPAMLRTAQTILQTGRAHEAARDCISIKEILDLIPGTR
jgi:phosphoenolpyruvate phosphomutase / 2-hydroxyethylphosphonate cytidylyltransferase